MTTKRWDDKDPDATLDYGVDWGTFLEDVSDTIAASDWLFPDGLNKELDSFTDTTTTVWISGGTAGTSYTVTNRITTAAGRVNDQSVKLKVKNL